MTDTIGIRDLLWEWARAYPERAGDSVSWPRMSAFGPDMVADRHRENPEPIDYKRAEEIDKAVLSYLKAIRKQGKRSLEESVFWARYFLRWEVPDVVKKVRKSRAWVHNTCGIIEGTIEGIYLVQIAEAG